MWGRLLGAWGRPCARVGCCKERHKRQAVLFRAVKDPKVVFLLTVIAALLATRFTGHPMLPACPIGARTQQMESRWIQAWAWRQQLLPLHPHRRPPSCLGQHPLAAAGVLA